MRIAGGVKAAVQNFVGPAEYNSLLRNCIHANSLVAGQTLHAHILKSGLDCDTFTQNTLLHMYSACGCISDAARTLDDMPKSNVISWTAVLSACVARKRFHAALDVFYRMIRTSVSPNHFSLASVLPVCSNLKLLSEGKQMHSYIIRSSFSNDVVVGTALVDMYARCEKIEVARLVFDKMLQKNVATFNVLISGYWDQGKVAEAENLFQSMPERDMVSWNEMITGYSKNGRLQEALKIFEITPDQDLISWNSAIGGCVKNGFCKKAVGLFQKMLRKGVEPSRETFAVTLPAWGKLADADTGKILHGMLIVRGFSRDVFVLGSLVDVYAKCGRIGDARSVFERAAVRDIVTWTAMITGYAIHGKGREALNLFQKMEKDGVKPDTVTFLGLLSACRHSGLVEEGLFLFQRMLAFYKLIPGMEHYCAMVDLLGRSGRLEQALDFINSMPVKADASVWGSLLAACRVHSNLQIGEYVAERLLEMDPHNARPYVLLSNLYASLGRWNEIENVRNLMKEKEVKKEPGCSWIFINRQLHFFHGYEHPTAIVF